MRTKITVHTVVRNEERYLWFAVASVVDYVDEVLLWDTGSTDNTPQIAQELVKKYKGKISFREIGAVDPEGFTAVRQKMLAETTPGWFIIVDGDEVWWDSDICELTGIIQKQGNLEAIVNRYYNIVGDIFHYQDESAGKYSIDGKVGHLTIRAMNTAIPGLHFGKPHGQQGIFDGTETLIQNRAKTKRALIDRRCYLHFTNVLRSSAHKNDLLVPKRGLKLKYEIGNSFPADFYFPEVFFREKPRNVPSPWIKMPKSYAFRASVETPLRQIKRKLTQSKSGY